MNKKENHNWSTGPIITVQYKKNLRQLAEAQVTQESASMILTSLILYFQSLVAWILSYRAQ